ncbi:suppressor of tumorigenicity 14 protein isoform X1 [Podarcis raffonei]|uniref:suppressor of tumorigenicity 14 protein isoform X1 n=2 Tax=Podarcis raffonei TaxID=65483 RepID=UPI00232917DA|nr:suppressor of tumorigenicity 14 protein isoform X1 [Podarcis raffonei]
MKDYRLPSEGKMNIYHPPSGATSKAYVSGLKYSNKLEDMNGLEEGLEFLPTMNAKKVEKRGPKRCIAAIAIVLVCLLLSLLAGFLVWHFRYRNAPVQKVYNGHLRLVGRNFIDAYENSNSPEFAALAREVKKMLINIYKNNQDVSPFHKETQIVAFSEGSIIAYYWSEFSVPKHNVEALDRAMANIQASNEAGMKQRGSYEMRVETVVAFPSDPDIIKAKRDNSCSYALHAKEGVVTSFTTPGFPNSAYPSNARCLWVLRADADSVISLTFTTFDLEPCNVGNDFVKVYDTLSPVEAHALVKLCGSYGPSYNLTFVSSTNVLLVMLITDATERYPGFKAEFFQMPKKKNCGADLTAVSGTFSSPYYPAHYPPGTDCVWNIVVPTDKRAKVRFNNFFLAEPGIPLNSCPKDYVEVNNVKYCGEKKQFVILSKTNKISVRFHSDLSLVDSGFSAEFMSYQTNDPCPGKFACNTGRCIAKTLRCDGYNDCTDASDEKNCTCTEKQFRCRNGYCKPKLWFCDGMDDCGDGSDEAECKCPANNIRCSNGNCIPESKKCDGKDDCGDGSDEGSCGRVDTVSCKAYTYKCRNNQCLSKKNPECDGNKDCSDNSDEDNCNCGKRFYSKQSRIVGGEDSDEGEWPWQVSFHTKDTGHFCGATLISQNWVVSAAHCFQDDWRRHLDHRTITAYMGLLDQGDRSNSNVQQRGLKRVIRHPYFNDASYDNDIAVAELSSPVEFNKYIQPICLPDVTHDFPVGKSLWVTGWGATQESGNGASILQKLEIRVINQTVCRSLMVPNDVTDRMMCVGVLTGGKDACQGDSGGPLVSLEANNTLFLAGVVSWGEGCAQRNKPGMYTRVSALRAWINEQTGV